MKTIGACSICGGRVTMPSYWLGIHPPTPECQSCGATKKQPYGPTVEMEPRPKPATEKVPVTGISMADLMSRFKVDDDGK